MNPAGETASDRASELLQQMTTAEKSAQIIGVLPHALGAPALNPELLKNHLGEGIGHICGVGTVGVGPARIAQMTNEIQRYLRENTRLGIPAIVHNEALNGVTAEGFTTFPTAIGLAATWNPDAIEEMADLLRRQLKSIGVRQALAPVLDIARDARWGRIHETYGEDPLLSSLFGVAYVRGMQGKNLTDGVVATAKHFIGYAMTEGGQNMAATHLGNRELRDVYSASFEAAIRIAGLESVMNSYSEIDGEPVTTSRKILTDLLRGTLGFNGTVVSDYRSIYYVVTRQGIGSAELTGPLSLHAGLDIELPAPYGFGEVTTSGVDSGTIPVENLDLAVHRVLTQKFALGLFDNPYVPDDPIVIGELAASGRELSRQITDQAITLLKNENGVLPLTNDIKSIAVIGPHADSVMAGFGNYTHPPFLETLKAIAIGRSNLAGMEQMSKDSASQKGARERMEAMARLDPEAIARRDYGAKSLYGALSEALPETTVTTISGCDIFEENETFDDALDAARKADVVVLAFGGRSAAFQGHATEGEGSDSATLELPKCQRILINAVAELGKPVVGVLYAGKPYALADIETKLDALITGYIPGPEGGASLAASLIGEVNPSGKLPFTVPRHVGQVPIYHAQKLGSGYRRLERDQFKSYVDLENSPLYPFGYGLSYSTFSLSELEVDADETELRVSASITNTSGPAGTEVVQLYVSAPAFVISRPQRQLAGFARVDLEPGESKAFTICVPLDRFGYTCEDGRYVVDGGTYGVTIGTSADDCGLTTEVVVHGTRWEVQEPNSTLPTTKIG